jgi:4-alpha-glucanotransferase
MAEKRAAGILMPLTSLPSAYGIGDMGPLANSFADFLYRCRQRYWQILPVTSIEKEQGYSPYSPASSVAGNIWLISPELLAEDGLLTKDELSSFQAHSTDHVDYEKVVTLKNGIFEKAYTNFRSKKQEPFEAFCHREAWWLDDYALYRTLKEHFKDNPWHQWPEDYKTRKLKSLLSFTVKHEAQIIKEKWLQYIFFKQWKSLKTYCNELNIELIGDLPFYISHDSVDVWSKSTLFALNKDGSVASAAGVPPDYFNANGQLWGMPVYRWEELKEQRYDWWVKRIRKNLETADILRLDHFRAFSEYWSVPAKEKTAIHGEWKSGPGASLFTVLQQEFGRLPFIAEDLGDISESVYKLRDQFHLPGMKVIQFAIGDNLAQSDHSPHNFSENFIVYTGTHDNNTTRGWYRHELKAADQKQIEAYTGSPVTETNVHLVLSRLAYASVAKTVILPLQDVLGLDEKSRMNTPASVEKNWMWQLKEEQLTPDKETLLREWTTLYGRTGGTGVPRPSLDTLIS